VIQIVEGSQSNAQLVGRRAATTEFFSFLDDDDEYLPGALDIRLAALEDSPSSSVVVTNGFVEVNGREVELYSRTRVVSENPFVELFRENWLHNCNHLFRSALVPACFFENAPPVLEWTWLAFRLCMAGKKIVTCTDPTFRYNDTPGSLSKSADFLAARVEIYDRMIAVGPPGNIERMIWRGASSAWHEIAVQELGRGRRLSAVRAHLRSMSCHRSGIKYASFSRHLFRPVKRADGSSPSREVSQVARLDRPLHRPAPHAAQRGRLGKRGGSGDE
jgi:hypothetical protein